MEEQQIMQDHWETVQQWRIDEDVSYNRTLSSTKARLGAGGVKTGSEAYNAQISKIESDYELAKERIASGATQGILDRYVGEAKTSYQQRSMISRAPKMKQTKEGEIPDRSYTGVWAGQPANWYADLEIGATEFQALTADEFLGQEFGYSDAYIEYFGEQEGLGLTARTTALKTRTPREDRGGGGNGGSAGIGGPGGVGGPGQGAAGGHF
jgi:hypothetical protein